MVARGRGSHRSVRGRTTTITVTALVTVTALAAPAAASLATQQGSVRREAVAEWALGDTRDTRVTLRGVEEDTNATGSGGSVSSLDTAEILLQQDYCDTSGAVDQIVDVDLTWVESGARLKYVEVLPNGYQKAKVQRPISLTGTIVRTPAGRNGTCGVATGPPAVQQHSMTGKVTANWEPDPGAPAVTDTPTPADLSWVRAAFATGKIEVRDLGLKSYLRQEHLSQATLRLDAHTDDGSDPSELFPLRS